MEETEQWRKYLALLILVALAVFLFYCSLPLFGGICGALVFYVIFKPLYLRLLRFTKHKTLSAALVMLASLILIIIPLCYLVWVSLFEISSVLNNTQAVQAAIVSSLSRLNLSNEAIVNLVSANLPIIAQIARGLIASVINNIVIISLNLLVLYLILYYALVETDKINVAVRDIVPFNQKNTEKLIFSFNYIIKTTLVANVVVSVIVGILLAIALALIGTPNFLFWAIASTIMAIIPIIGIQIIWIPFGIVHLLSGDYVGGAGILLWGAFLSYIFDGYLRQWVQKDYGELHPFVSLVGLVIGITYFGIVGIVLGPLILGMFVPILKMFKEEYLPGW